MCLGVGREVGGEPAPVGVGGLMRGSGACAPGGVLELGRQGAVETSPFPRRSK